MPEAIICCCSNNMLSSWKRCNTYEVSSPCVLLLTSLRSEEVISRQLPEIVCKHVGKHVAVMEMILHACVMCGSIGKLGE